MSQIYDNWEKLLAAVLKREQFRRLALSDSVNSSYISSAPSSFNLGSASPFPSYVEHSGSQFEPGDVRRPLPNKFKWEIDPAKLDFSDATFISKVSSGGLIKASWYRTPVAVKRIIPSFSDESLVIQDFRNEINLLMKLRHPNIVQFLGAVTESKPLLFITEYLTGGSLDQHVKEKGPLGPSTAIDFAMDIASIITCQSLMPDGRASVLLHEKNI
ncbi:Non-specific protein-tyrosine kinase [Handroanthus impetiginosus]|uniref:Non-specific protein-tyrosine kinase n=1 Tax=Handroanthus impetiginosus TaxID=429701 RepID=A0A2G9GJ34_9LAMI|nr:Non-specific protein-tyrosine kinase [Handroanthus impetiginosus]